MTEPRNPNPVDVHVGQRLRAARLMKGLSQEAVATGVGLTFQQIQKYEKGINRVSASRLVQFALLFDQRVEWFFDGAPGYDVEEISEKADVMAGFFALPFAADVAANYIKIKHNADRDVVRTVTFALAGRPAS